MDDLDDAADTDVEELDTARWKQVNHHVQNNILRTFKLLFNISDRHRIWTEQKSGNGLQYNTTVGGSPTGNSTLSFLMRMEYHIQSQ